MYTGLVCDAIIKHKIRPTRIVVSHSIYIQLLMEQLNMYRYLTNGEEILMIMGIRVDMSPPHEFCRNCGAPQEPHVCSYCHSPSTFIEIT